MIRIFTLLLLFFCFLTKANAFYNPLEVANNRFGIHIADSNDISQVASLVNSSGGDWGYVTLVITENERDTDRWQKVFDSMRRFHLIPIVRLATRLEGDSWVKPSEENLDIWVTFLSSLNWPIENRYVVVYNEPNHAKEWGNSVDPEGYADILTKLSDKLKAASGDYFILPAGLDASAPSNATSMDETEFLDRMAAASPRALDIIDGWTSHSYPNPGFSGTPLAWGKGTLRTYAWELEYLRMLGFQKNLPVFITETGWTHAEGKQKDPSLLSADTLSSYIVQSSQVVWSDERIAAVTPFVYSYQDIPFDHFSWKKLGVNEFYDHYFAYQNIQKLKGLPKQHHRYIFETPLLPLRLVAESSYELRTRVRNDGQAILNPTEYTLNMQGETDLWTLRSAALPLLEPGQSETIAIRLDTPNTPGPYRLEFELSQGDTRIPLFTRTVTVLPQPSVVLEIPLGWKEQPNGDNATVKVINSDGQLVHAANRASLIRGTITVEHLKDIIPNHQYTITVHVPYYAPVSVKTVLLNDKQAIRLPRALPLDLNNDSRVTFDDIPAIFGTNPITLYHRFIGD